MIQIKKSKLPPLEMLPTDALILSAKEKEKSKPIPSAYAFLKRFHKREVKLGQMPFWSFNFKKYL